jgi:orotidine-5'-phosphate decarboxylase
LPRTSLVLACDMPPDQLTRVVQATASVPEVAAYKIGAALALELGLGVVVKEIRNLAPEALIIYDHQKASTDIPDTGLAFMDAMKRCGVDAVILFPLSGPATETAWITAAQGEGLEVIVGCHMTHAEFLASDGGYIDDEAVARAYELARDRGIRDFVVPGNNPAAIRDIRARVETGDNGVLPDEVVRYFAPGFVAQGGEITEAAHAAGSNWHAIVGRGVYATADPAAAARQLASKLR